MSSGGGDRLYISIREVKVRLRQLSPFCVQPGPRLQMPDEAAAPASLAGSDVSGTSPKPSVDFQPHSLPIQNSDGVSPLPDVFDLMSTLVFYEPSTVVRTVNGAPSISPG